MKSVKISKSKQKLSAKINQLTPDQLIEKLNNPHLQDKELSELTKQLIDPLRESLNSLSVEISIKTFRRKYTAIFEPTRFLIEKYCDWLERRHTNLYGPVRRKYKDFVRYSRLLEDAVIAFNFNKAKLQRKNLRYSLNELAIALEISAEEIRQAIRDAEKPSGNGREKKSTSNKTITNRRRKHKYSDSINKKIIMARKGKKNWAAIKKQLEGTYPLKKFTIGGLKQHYYANLSQTQD